MSHQVVELECPGCAASISTSTKTCPKCFRPIVISTFRSISNMSPLDLNKQASAYRKAMVGYPDDEKLNMSIAFCYLKLKLYDKAISCFEKALEENFDNADVYFYAAVAMLKGKPAFMASKTVINKIEEYLNAAVMIEPKGIYYYYWAYIQYDYYCKKRFNAVPGYKKLLEEAAMGGYSENDVEDLFQLLGTSRPDCM